MPPVTAPGQLPGGSQPVPTQTPTQTAASTTTTSGTAGAPAAGSYGTYADENAVLTAVGRDPAQWHVVGRAMEVKSQTTQDPQTTLTTTKQEPTGNYVWVISGPNGQTDNITVRPGGGQPVGGGQQGPAPATYDIVKGPSRELGQTPPPPKENDTRQNVQGGYQVQEIYKGNQWVVDPTVAPVPFTPEAQARPADGATRQNVQGGYQVQEIYRGGQWVVDPNVPPKPFTPQAQREGQLPQENDTRQNVQNGYQVQEVYKGGQWVIDPNVPPKPFTPEAQKQATDVANAPTQGQTRINVQGGFQVHEIYQGGQWIVDPKFPPVPFTPDAQKSAAAPKEGDTRPNVNGGFQVQEIYKGGQWVVDPTVPPKRWTPQAPTTVNAPADQPNIVTRDENGNITTTPSPNYIPTDPALRAGQLQNQITQKRADLDAQVKANTITADQATDQFNQWYSGQIQPQIQAIQQAQAQQNLKNQIDAAQSANQTWQAANQAQTAATGYGQQAADVALRTMPYRVGPGFGQALNQMSSNFANAAKGIAPQPVDLQSALVYHTQDPNDIYKQATAQAIAHLSPTAAGIAGMPFPQVPNQPDYVGALNGTQYTPFGGGAPPAAAGGIPGQGTQGGGITAVANGQAVNSAGAPSTPGLNATATNVQEPGIWNTPMTFQNGRMVPAPNAPPPGPAVQQQAPPMGSAAQSFWNAYSPFPPYQYPG